MFEMKGLKRTGGKGFSRKLKWLINRLGNRLSLREIRSVTHQI